MNKKQKLLLSDNKDSHQAEKSGKIETPSANRNLSSTQFVINKH
jgi:hypothetical protein